MQPFEAILLMDQHAKDTGGKGGARGTHGRQGEMGETGGHGMLVFLKLSADEAAACV